MSEHLVDPWEIDEPEFPPPTIGEDVLPSSRMHTRHNQVRSSRPYVSALGAAVILALSVAPSEMEPPPSAESLAARIQQQQNRQRAFFIHHSIKWATQGRFSDCHNLPTLPPQFFRWWNAKLSSREVQAAANGLRTASAKPPLTEDPLLDYNARLTARKLADNPDQIPGFNQSSPDRARIADKGFQAGKWTAVKQIVLQAGNGQTAMVAGCLVDNVQGFQTIQDADYIGVGTAKGDHNLRTWVVELASTPNPS